MSLDAAFIDRTELNLFRKAWGLTNADARGVAAFADWLVEGVERGEFEIVNIEDCPYGPAFIQRMRIARTRRRFIERCLELEK